MRQDDSTRESGAASRQTATLTSRRWREVSAVAHALAATTQKPITAIPTVNTAESVAAALDVLDYFGDHSSFRA